MLLKLIEAIASFVVLLVAALLGWRILYYSMLAAADRPSIWTFGRLVGIMALVSVVISVAIPMFLASVIRVTQ